MPDPKIDDPRDAVVRVTSGAICGSEMRGIAREDFEPPKDMRTPVPLRPRGTA